MTTPALDDLDARLIRTFTDDPHIGVLGASRVLGVARGTVQARLDRLIARGIVVSHAPQVDVAAMGFPVTAFVTLEIQQGEGPDAVVDALAAIAEVIEAHTITGEGDLMVRVVARDNADLQRVLDRLVAIPAVRRAATVIALTEKITYRTLPLVMTHSTASGEIEAADAR